VPAESILSQIVAQGFGGLLTNLATSYINRDRRSIKSDTETVKRDLSDHLEATFRKCKEVKTILNDNASQTLEIYVDQYFLVGEKAVDQYEMIDRVRQGDSLIILGQGGGGKSMFMRYLWLSYFEKSDGRIPFFIELRNLNSFTHRSVSDFIYHSVVKTGSTIRQSEFDQGLKNGEFVLFLDGFDEINFDRRDAIQDMILDLKDNNPKLTIVVTSRHDERFMGWRGFVSAKVQPLDQKHAKILIERADYAPDLKKKFLQKFPKLFLEHKDFLSNPLLAYMMLVTFSYNPDIPRRMFLFYEQAFEALYHRHDLTKGYKRVFHCNLDKVDFIRLIAYFCLKTYFDEELEFTRIEILDAIEKSKEIEQTCVNAEDFLQDLVQSVCIMKVEGITYSFTHRSFQEYFAAYCLSRVAIRKVDDLFIRFSRRFSDNVLPMVSDINPDLFREKFIVPNFLKHKEAIETYLEDNPYEWFAGHTGATFTVSLLERLSELRSPKEATSKLRDYSISLVMTGELPDFYRIVLSVATDKQVAREVKNIGGDHEFVTAARKILGDASFPISIEVVDYRISFFHIEEKKKKVQIAEDKARKLASAFEKSRMNEYLADGARLFVSYVQKEVAAYERVSGAFEDYF
jgi:predicted RNA-binding protein Jag